MRSQIFILLFLLPSIFITAQTYDLSIRQNTFQPLENGISLIDGESLEGFEFTLPIGFDFLFFDSVIDSLYSTVLDITVLSDIDDISNATGVFSAIVPLSARLVNSVSETGESLSELSYLVEGAEGSRICKIEWLNAGLGDTFENGVSTDFVNFQIWLYEEDGTIELHFGTSNITIPFELFEGGGPFIWLVNSFNLDTSEFDEILALEGDPSNPSVVYLDEYGYDYYYETTLDAMPANGTIYSFTRESVSTDEIRKLSTQFSVQPNPAQSSIRLKTQMDYSDIESVSIYNSSGGLMKTLLTDYDNIDLYGFSAGMYNMQILTNEGMARQRFVKID